MSVPTARERAERLFCLRRCECGAASCRAMVKTDPSVDAITAAIEAAVLAERVRCSSVCDKTAARYDARRDGETAEDIVRRFGKATVAHELASEILTGGGT